jgi:hypothetical protein
MAVELITGHAGTDHVDSADWAGYNRGFLGDASFVMPVGTQAADTVVDANTLRVGSFEAIFDAHHVRETLSTDNTIANVTPGYYRCDLVCLRYTKNEATGVETVSEVVISGAESTSATPPLPTSGFYPNGAIVGYTTPSTLYHIWDGATTVDWPLYVVVKSNSSMTATANFTTSMTMSQIMAAAQAAPTFAKIYPVGAVYESTASTDPSQLFPGTTWQTLAPGRMLIGAGSNGSTTYTAGATGGAESFSTSHEHTVPTHRHDADTSMHADLWTSSQYLFYKQYTPGSEYPETQGNSYLQASNFGSQSDESTLACQVEGHTTYSGQQTTGSASVSSSLLSPYEVVYRWQRVS